MLHFVNFTIDKENNFFTNSYSMQLNEDFIQKLKTHGRLPEPTTNAYFDEIAKVEALSKENQIMKEQFEEMKKASHKALEEEKKVSHKALEEEKTKVAKLEETIAELQR